MPTKNLILKERAVLAAALVVFLIPVLAIGYNLLVHTNGVLSLPRDEAFLQLSTAKTLAFRQVWGIGRQDFAAATPSLLFPVVLAILFIIFGLHLLIIPIANTVVAIILLTVIQRWLKVKGIKPLTQLVVLLAVIFLTPLPLMAVYDMERPLLLLFAFLFTSRLIDEWNMPEFSRRTLIYGALMVATSYDGSLLIVGVCLLLLWRRRWLVAFELVLWSLLPVIVFGIIAMFKGSYFLPNEFVVEPAGSLLSYDWLIGCGIAVAAPLLLRLNTKPPSATTKWAGGLGILILTFILMTRNLYALQEKDNACVRVFRQEYPVGQFLHRYFKQYPIASDDVGIISYLTDTRYLDLSGLASNKVARHKNDHSISAELIEALGNKQDICLAVISEQYSQGLPEKWIKTASWEMPAYDLFDKKTFTFYAKNSTLATRLKEDLEEYSFFLPRDITTQYFYTPPPEKKKP